MTSSGPVPGCHWLPRFHFLSFRTPRREDAISVDRIQSFLIGRRQSPTLEVGSTILKYLSISLQVQKGPKDCLLPFTMTFHEPTNRIACLDHRFEGPKDTQVAFFFFGESCCSGSTLGPIKSKILTFRGIRFWPRRARLRTDESAQRTSRSLRGRGADATPRGDRNRLIPKRNRRAERRCDRRSTSTSEMSFAPKGLGLVTGFMSTVRPRRHFVVVLDFLVLIVRDYLSIFTKDTIVIWLNSRFFPV